MHVGARDVVESHLQVGVESEEDMTFSEGPTKRYLLVRLIHQ
jgi:hypothetical protein